MESTSAPRGEITFLPLIAHLIYSLPPLPFSPFSAKSAGNCKSIRRELEERAGRFVRLGGWAATGSARRSWFWARLGSVVAGLSRAGSGSSGDSGKQRLVRELRVVWRKIGVAWKQLGRRLGNFGLMGSAGQVEPAGPLLQFPALSSNSRPSPPAEPIKPSIALGPVGRIRTLHRHPIAQSPKSPIAQIAHRPAEPIKPSIAQSSKLLRG